MDRIDTAPPLSAQARDRLDRLYRLYSERVLRYALAVRTLPAEPAVDAEALALADLTARQATVIKLAAQGLSQSTIASRMGRSPGAVSSHLRCGARKLRSGEMAR